MGESSTLYPTPFLFAVIFEGGIGLVAVGLGWLLGDPPAQRIHWTADAAAQGLLATIPLVAVIWACMRSGWRPLRDLLQLLEEKVLPMFAGTRVWEFAGIAIFAGFGEEMLFRGVIQNAIARWLDASLGIYIALVVASLMFGLLHWLTSTYAMLAAIIGLYLGGLWILTENLLVPALVHTLYDFWALLYLVRLRPPSSPHKEG